MATRWYYRKPRTSDFPRIARISGAVFKGNADTKLMIRKANPEESLVATVDGIVVGVYLIGDKQILETIRQAQKRRAKIKFYENLEPYESKKGIEGLLLAVLSQYRGNGIGRHLIRHPSTLGKDYIWCYSGKCFKAFPHWLKRERLVAELREDYMILQDFN